MIVLLLSGAAKYDFFNGKIYFQALVSKLVKTRDSFKTSWFCVFSYTITLIYHRVLLLSYNYFYFLYYIQFNKQQQDGKDEKSFSIGKKKGHDDFIKSAEESEEHYKQCVHEANKRQSELERIKSDSLIELRQIVYQCDMTMKQVICYSVRTVIIKT